MDCEKCGTANFLTLGRGAPKFVADFIQGLLFLTFGLVVWGYFGIPGIVILMVALFVLGRLINPPRWIVESAPKS